MQRKLENAVSVITGAGSGIGRAIAVLFASEGSRVALVDFNGLALEALAEEMAAAKKTCLVFKEDVSDSRAADRTIQTIVSEWGGIDVLVTSAAISTGGTVTTISEEDWDRVFDINAKGVFLWARAVLPHMVQSGRGSIITIASQLAIAGGRGNAPYVASKGAVISLTRSIALDYSQHGVRANILVPGAVETAMLERSFARQSDPETARQRSLQRHPLKRFGRPQEVASAALYLASEDSSFTTGAQLMVDGGWVVG